MGLPNRPVARTVTSARSACRSIERLEARLLLSLTPTFGASGLLSPSGESVADYAFGRFNGDNALDLTVRTTHTVGFNTTTTRYDSFGNNGGTFILKNRVTDTDQNDHFDLTDGDYQTGDFNGDGKADLFADIIAGGFGGNASPDRYYVKVFPGDGTGAFAADPKGNGARYDIADGGLGTAFTTADVTGDGKTDVVIAGNIGVEVDSDTNGSGNYDIADLANDISGVLPMINALDVTGDGQRDLIFGVETAAHDRLYVIPRTVKKFGAPVAAAELAGRPLQARYGDFDGDGILDVAVLETPRSNPGASEAVEILRGRGDGTFLSVADIGINGKPGGIAVADFDGDGRLDVAMGLKGAFNHQSTTIAVFTNNGNFNFTTRFLPGYNDDVDKLDSADFNNDGKPDLILRDTTSGKLYLLLNTTKKPNVATGKVFNDVDGDGVQDGGESGLGGRLVYGDNNNNSIPEAGESFAYTSADGSYRLPFAAGTATYVREQLPAGWYETPGYNPPATLGHYTGVLAGGVTLSGYNFSQNYRGTISGRVFNDTNGNGTYDFDVVINGIRAFESGTAGRTVYLDKNNNGKLDSGETSTVSNAQGVYGFDVGPGTYTVRDVHVAGELDTNSTARTIGLGAGVAVYRVSFGHTKPGGVSGTVFYDASRIGHVVDAASTPGIAGVRVYLDADRDGVYDSGEPSAVTDSKGKYAIANQFPGRALVRVVKPRSGYAFTGPATGYYDTTIFGGSTGPGTDFGLVYPARVTGNVFNDKNKNGHVDSGEAGVANFSVFIDYNGNGTPDTAEPLVLTDSDGDYTLDSTRAGSFKVILRKLSGYNNTQPGASSRTVNFVQGSTVGGQDFGVVQGPFSTAPYKSPVNIATTSNPVALAAGDFNKDGKADFIVAGDNSVAQVFLGRGNGTFTHDAAKDFVIGGATRFMVVTDVNSDGKPDLVAADQDDNFDTGSPGGVAVCIGNGDGTFKPAAHYQAAGGTYGVAVADFNGDGRPDLVTANSAASSMSVLLNKGGGLFSPAKQVATPFGATGVAAGDIDRDGKTDVVLASPGDGSITLIKGNGNGTFAAQTRMTSGANGPSFVTLADLNKDARLDLVFINPDANQVVVRVNGGGTSFGSPAAYATVDFPQQVTVFDVDRDGAVDLVVSGRSDGTSDISGGVSLFRGLGNGTFADPKIATAHTSPTAVAVADFTGDGKLDLLAANFYSSDVSLLVNATAAV